MFYGVKYAKNSGNVSLSVAVKTSDNKIFVESIDCRPIRDGNQWIISYLRNAHAEKVAIDGAGNQDMLVNEMKDAGVKCKPILPTVRDVQQANAIFEQKLFAKEICHKNQPSLTQAVTNAEHRAIGNGERFRLQFHSETVDVSLLESVSLTHWLAVTAKEKRKQRIFY